MEEEFRIQPQVQVSHHGVPQMFNFKAFAFARDPMSSFWKTVGLGVFLFLLLFYIIKGTENPRDFQNKPGNLRT